MKMIRGLIARLTARIARARQYPDRRLARAMACPECEHSTVEASPWCLCTDPGCLCVALHETQR